MKEVKIIFDRKGASWDENPMFNEWFLNEKLIYLEDLLKRQGYLTIMDILSEIGVLDNTDLKAKDMYLFKIPYKKYDSKIALTLEVRDLWDEEAWE